MELIGFRKLKELIDRVDVVLEVVDIRNPLATQSKLLESLVKRSGRDLILVLNKCDLVPLWVSKAWSRYFQQRGYKTVYVSATKHYGSRYLRRRINELITLRPATLLVAGFPKVGKSSIINMLKGKDSAPTSPFPGSHGYTKASQLYRIGQDLYLIDTPGIVPPRGDDIEMIIRSRPVESFEDPVPVCVKLINYILSHNPRAFKQAYGIDSSDPIDILTKLALKRGWIYKKTKEPNLEEAARTIIRDYHRGKIPFYVLPPEPV